MIEVVEVSFKPKGKIYYFLPNKLPLKKGDSVIVETDRGLQFGIIQKEITKVEEKKLKSSLK